LRRRLEREIQDSRDAAHSRGSERQNRAEENTKRADENSKTAEENSKEQRCFASLPFTASRWPSLRFAALHCLSRPELPRPSPAITPRAESSPRHAQWLSPGSPRYFSERAPETIG